MKGYRYNCDRELRAFNNTGREKNPLRISFYAKSMEYAEKYRYIYHEDGSVAHECELEVKEINANLFDMTNFKDLTTYKDYVENEISRMRKDYEKYLSEAKTKAKKKMWQENIDSLNDHVKSIDMRLKATNFQGLSDFENQIQLVSELKAMGFDGYETEKEIAVW